MNDARSAAGTFMLLAILGGCATPPAETGGRISRLEPCSAEGSVFEDEPFKNWPDIYHDRVSAAVEAHMDETTPADMQLQCTEEEYEELIPPSDALKTIAEDLPAWKDKVEELGEGDIGPVLLEFLRIYECSLNEYDLFITARVQEELADDEDALEAGGINRGAFNKSITESKRTIAEERRVARVALDRTLRILGGQDRLRPLSLDVECLKRASLDLRNVLGLAADVSSCLPRVWDAHGSLFTPARR